MLRMLAVLAAVAVGATTVLAQNLTPIQERKAAFKAMAGANKEPGGMLKGDVPFDAAKVQATLTVFQAQAAKLKDLFPDDSKTGGDTEALPAIWEKKADFNARMDKFAADAKAAAAAIKDEASFKAEMPKVLGNCGACHKEYRKAK